MKSSSYRRGITKERNGVSLHEAHTDTQMDVYTRSLAVHDHRSSETALF